MPYFIFVVTSKESGHKSARLVKQFEKFREAKNEVKRLRSEKPLDDNQIYKINFSATEMEAEQALTETREEPIAKEWEK
jgi:hypothetical protein